MNRRNGGRLKFSVIIPCWNDVENLAELLPALRKIDNCPEIIVVDATRDRSSEQIALAADAVFISSSEANRGQQMNRGAEIANVSCRITPRLARSR